MYHEKTRAGLTINGDNGAPLFIARFPERIYSGFEDIPPLVVDILLFIENRELLDARYPNRNPAVEWDRLAKAFAELLNKAVDSRQKAVGGSTLATQIEKFRHSPGGRTPDALEKLRQMASASVRAYLDGADTTAARRKIVVDYLNSTPLGGRRGFGEIIGLGDGLWAWFGTDLEAASAILRTPAKNERNLKRRALVYKQVLSLLLAQRRPTFYLTSNRGALERLTDSYLRLLGSAGVIDQSLRDASLQVSLRLADAPPAPTTASFVDQKAANSIRARLLPLLGASSSAFRS